MVDVQVLGMAPSPQTPEERGTPPPQAQSGCAAVRGEALDVPAVVP